MNILYAVALLGTLGGLFGLALSYAAKVFSVPVDDREAQITALLPGANCGGCGFAGCGGCAEAIVSGRAAVSACVPGGNETAVKVAEIMGVESEKRELQVAFVRCAGANLRQKYEYSGVKDCLAATLVGSAGGSPRCEQGCLGFGSCVEACRFHALHIVDGVARVDSDACTGCGQCVAACPKKLIALIPYGTAVTVPCAGRDKGSVSRKNCDSGCIACGKCEKSCTRDAIHVVDGHAVIDYEKCSRCGDCAESCPRSLIRLDPRFVP